MTQREIRRLDELMDGALTERFNYEMERVLQNVFDPNTEPQSKRSITITIGIAPNERRDAAEFKIEVKSRLAQTKAVSQTMLINQSDDGVVTATELTGQVPGQMNIEGDEFIPRVVSFGNE